MFPFNDAEAIPQWVQVIGATVPNIVIGVLILVFRRHILTVVKALFPSMSKDAEFWASRVIVLGGLFLIVVAGSLLFGFVQMLVNEAA